MKIGEGSGVRLVGDLGKPGRLGGLACQYTSLIKSLIFKQGNTLMHFHNKYLAEMFGTFWLVLGGCGSTIFAATFASDAGINIGLVGVSLAFGLTVMTMAYAVGHVSGGHFNPAVSIGLWVGGRFGFGHLIPYIVFQVLGAIGAAFVLQWFCLLYTSPSPRDQRGSRMPSSA